MMPVRADKPRRLVKGTPSPRIAPPIPARSRLKDFKALSSAIGIDLFPWQETAVRYLTALDRDGRNLYPEVAIIVARQQGKTTLLIPYITERLLAGARIMHTAQNRELPREIHAAVAEVFLAHHRDKLRTKPRYANGQEEIRLRNGGIYRIVAPTRGGARGPSNDVVIIDELREMDTNDFIAASKPTLTASANPQMLYLSNAGTDESVVLNALRDRAAEDPSLAYLEWSAAPEMADDDLAGWRQANPAMGHIPGVQEYLTREYRANQLADTMGIFETEHLCRWVKTLAPKIVSDDAWAACEGPVGNPVRPVMGINMDPDGSRCSAVLAWLMPSGQVALRVVADVEGDPIDTYRLGPELAGIVAQMRVTEVVFDPWTDADLVRYFRKSRAINGVLYTNASGKFASLVEAGGLRWQGAEIIGRQLADTIKKAQGQGRFMAVRSNADRPVTAVLAAIRACWVASEPKRPAPRIM